MGKEKTILVVMAAFLGLLFGLIAGDDGAPLWLSLLQWQLQTLIPILLILAVQIALERHRRKLPSSHWLRLTLYGLLGAILFSPIALAIDLWLQEGLAQSLGGAWLEELLAVGPPVVVAWLGMNALLRLAGTSALASVPESDAEPAGLGKPPSTLLASELESAPKAALEPESELENEPEPEFMQRVPAAQRGCLRYLKAELHYLQVVTDRGSSLILFNLRDAVAQLPEGLGVQPHRSYWVRRSDVEAMRRQGRQGELCLRGGERIPVSRSKLAQMQALWPQ
ncbi:LytTR family DNA-binding domain-containing protein [Ferrimonas marina]|uniref:LytTR family DNA-binding domain-containing protein n=1 Tax=Ferrimonas marina TaxID=299255 RepID=UPI00147063EC|nr:LytTR family DNA-binding domain-containing protein [Ferrimonas marina]